MTNFERQDWRCARKSHKCSLCGETIQSGELYLRCVAMIDGEFYDNCTTRAAPIFSRRSTTNTVMAKNTLSTVSKTG